MRLIARVRRVLLLGVAVLFASVSAAQGFPTRAVKILCPFAPGGATDIAARRIADEMSKILGQPVIVENKPGAGGNVAGQQLAASPADGYTLLLTSNGIQTFNPTLYRNMPFDPNRDFSFVASLVSFNYVLVVGSSSTWKTVSELIAAVQGEPGKYSFASAGQGTSMHLSGELFKSMVKVDVTHVPYKGTAPALGDLFSGTVTMMFGDIPGVLGLIRGGKLRALAVTGASRSPLLPDIPTMAEAGLKDYDVTAWFALVAPKGTPEAVVSALSSAAVKAAESPSFRGYMEPLGYNIIAGGPQNVSAMVQRDLARWVPIIRNADIRLN